MGTTIETVEASIPIFSIYGLKIIHSVFVDDKFYRIGNDPCPSEECTNILFYLNNWNVGLFSFKIQLRYYSALSLRLKDSDILWFLCIKKV